MQRFSYFSRIIFKYTCHSWMRLLTRISWLALSFFTFIQTQAFYVNISFIWQTTNIDWNKQLTLWRLKFLYNLRQLSSYTRSNLISSFRSTLSKLKRGQQYLGALVAIVRSNRYIHGQKYFKWRFFKTLSFERVSHLKL